MARYNIPSLPRKPFTPKPKGKKPKRPKQIKGADLNPLDRMGGGMNADVGAGSSNKLSIYAVSKKVDHSDLDKLDKIIQGVQSRILKRKKNRGRQGRISKEISEAMIRKRIQGIDESYPI